MKPYKVEVDDMAHCFYLAGTDHVLELLVPKMLLHIQVVLEKNHYQEVHHVQDPAKAS